MRKYETEIRPWQSLKPGDRIVVSFGILQFESIERLKPHYVRMHLKNEMGEDYHETHCEGDWPEVVTGLTPEYQASHPDESIETKKQDITIVQYYRYTAKWHYKGLRPEHWTEELVWEDSASLSHEESQEEAYRRLDTSDRYSNLVVTSVTMDEIVEREVYVYTY
jgi:hypothetical protein